VPLGGPPRDAWYPSIAAIALADVDGNQFCLVAP
jgi:hypothetical protein